jgi:acyl-CoA thioester hydrolase
MENLLHSYYIIRFGDCDPFRHLNNARYLDYFMNAREDHLRDHYQMDLASYYKTGMGWVVVSHEISYLKPAAFNEKVCIKTGLLEAGNELLLAEMLMLDEKETHLKAILHSRFVPVSLTTGKREAHTPEFMDFISGKTIVNDPAQRINLPERLAFWQKSIRSLPAL